MLSGQPSPFPVAEHRGAWIALQAALDGLEQVLAGETPAPVDLGRLADNDRALVCQMLGEGEVAVLVAADADGVSWQAQESVLAGVWHVLRLKQGQRVDDHLEVGAFPQAIGQLAQQRAGPWLAWPAPWPEGALHAPSVLEAVRGRAEHWAQAVAAGGARPEPHVTNLTLKRLSKADSLLLDQHLGTGCVQVLSRGYGNCRVASTQAAHVWRVSYFNAQDQVILDTMEVGDVPEVACAARQDLQDSAQRLREVLQWVETV